MKTTITFEFENTENNFDLVSTKLCSEGVTMLLPEILQDLNEEELKAIFSSNQTPTIAKRSSERNISFSLHYSEIDIREISDDFITNVVDVQDQTLSRVVPGYEKYSIISKQLDGNTVACLLYRSYSLQYDLYNILFAFVHKNMLIQGNFSCLLNEQEAWTMVFQACLESLKFNVGEGV